MAGSSKNSLSGQQQAQLPHYGTLPPGATGITAPLPRERKANMKREDAPNDHASHMCRSICSLDTPQPLLFREPSQPHFPTHQSLKCPTHASGQDPISDWSKQMRTHCSVERECETVFARSPGTLFGVEWGVTGVSMGRPRREALVIRLGRKRMRCPGWRRRTGEDVSTVLQLDVAEGLDWE